MTEEEVIDGALGDAVLFEEVPEGRKDNLTGQKLRFELCEDLSKDFTK